MDVTQSRKELQRSESIKNEMCQVSFSTQLSSCLPLCSYGIQCHLLLGFEEHFPRKGLAHQGLTLSDRAPKSPPSIKPGCKIQNNLNLFCPNEFETWLKLDTTMDIQCIYHLRFNLGLYMRYYLGYHLLQKLLRVQSGSPSHPNSSKLGWALGNLTALGATH